jgi:hypothetical protein
MIWCAFSTDEGNLKCAHHIDVKAGANEAGTQALQLMLIPGGCIPSVRTPSWERNRDGSLKSAAHDGTAEGELLRRHSPHKNRYDIQVRIYAPTTLATAGTASAHKHANLSNILANISVPCHSTKLDVEQKRLRENSTWSSLSLLEREASRSMGSLWKNPGTGIGVGGAHGVFQKVVDSQPGMRSGCPLSGGRNARPCHHRGFSSCHALSSTLRQYR